MASFFDLGRVNFFMEGNAGRLPSKLGGTVRLVSITGNRFVVTLASYNRASPTAVVKEEGLAACTSTLIDSLKPLMKHPTCWAGVNFSARVKSFSNWVW